MKDLKIGNLYYDKNREWTGGSDVEMVHLVLSADPINGELFWKVASFLWVGDGYKGAHVHKFTEDEIRLMEHVGSILDIKKFT